jgi:hypothetical protein
MFAGPIRLGIRYLAPITLYSLHIANLGLDLNRASSKSTPLKYPLLGQYPRSNRANKQSNRSRCFITNLAIAVHGLHARKSPHEGFILACRDCKGRQEVHCIPVILCAPKCMAITARSVRIVWRHL